MANSITGTAPADTAVKYRTVKYNISTKSNRFVGAGPEVDEAWREISYNSESKLSPTGIAPAVCNKKLTT
jgi:hypothetical protein